MNWSEIENDLSKIYEKYELLESFEKDNKYLKSSFEKIERMWLDNYNQIESINIIMISEAPLFGEKENYIYNKNTKPNSFFWFNDIEFLPNYEKPDTLPKTIYDKKEMMINQFIKSGLIIFDIFPFALNKKNTKINYQKMPKKLYNDLLDFTKESYLKPKLQLCLDKTHNNPHFVYRYKRLYSKTGNYLEKVLKEMKRDDFKLDSIHGTNMSLDTKKLYNLSH